MKKYMILLILVTSLFCSKSFSLVWQEQDKILVNQLSIRVRPEILIYNDTHTSSSSLDLTSTLQTEMGENGEFSFNYDVPQLDMKISFIPFNGNYQVQTRIDYKLDTEIKSMSVILDTPSNTQFLSGPEAIMQQDYTLNRLLTPFSNKIVQYSSGTNKFWVIGSHWDGTYGIERINTQQIFFYDYHEHFAYFWRLDSIHNWYPRKVGDFNEGAFLITEAKPFFPLVNYYPAGKKAALCISNDADGESDIFLKAAYFGTSDTLSADYKQKGLAANHIKVTNTVFGMHYPAFKPIWDELVSYGNSIGYHTYSGNNDDIDLLRNSLLYEMRPYNMKVWIDHAGNYEDFANFGTFPDSSWYCLDIVEESGLKYVWIMQNQSTAGIDAFIEYDQLPHRVYAITNKPIYFFRRRMCSEWIMPNMPWNSFSVNVTAPNLDNLIANHGLFIVYCHFCLFTWSDLTRNFLTYDEESNLATLKPEANACFQMMDDYQQHHGLWIDTTENVFDRLLASDSLMIKNVLVTESNIQFKLKNTSSTTLDDIELTYYDQVATIHQLDAGADYIITFAKSDSEITEFHYLFNDIHYSSSTSGAHKIFTFSKPIQSDLKSVAIYNIRGQKLDHLQYSLNYDKLELDLSKKSSGIYFLKLEDKQHFKKLIRFVFMK